MFADSLKCKCTRQLKGLDPNANISISRAKKTPPFDLMTSFPTKVLADSNQSLKDAGLINATVVQKLK
jgi:hypothetical protein